MKLRTNLFVSIKILEQLCVLWHSNLRIINLMWKIKWEKIIHSEHTLFNSTWIFVITTYWYHVQMHQKHLSMHKNTRTTGIFTMVEWHTNRNVFRSILDCGQIRMIRSQTVKMPATAYLNILMLSTVTDDDWLEKTARAKKKP